MKIKFLNLLQFICGPFFQKGQLEGPKISMEFFLFKIALMYFNDQTIIHKFVP